MEKRRQGSRDMDFNISSICCSNLCRRMLKIESDSRTENLELVNSSRVYDNMKTFKSLLEFREELSKY